MTFVIKVTKRCNMRCRYCYEHAHHGKGDVFNLDKLKKVYGRIYEYYRKIPGVTNLRFVWHGGEPMLLPASFYRGALDLQESTFPANKFTIENQIQTNLTILNDEYLEIFKSGKLGTIGVSFDVINTNRVFRNGRSTESAVINNLNILRREGVKHSGLCVLSRQNVDNVDEIYNFFRERNMSFCLLPVYYEGSIDENDYAITPQEYAKASIKLFDLWFDDDDTEIVIEQFATMIEALTHGSGESECFFSKSCAEHVMYINPDGKAYNCARMDYGRYVYGNILKESLDKIMQSKARKALLGRPQRIAEECGHCEYLGICRGGCPNLGQAPKDRLSKSTMCPYFKAMFKHIEKRLKQVSA